VKRMLAAAAATAIAAAALVLVPSAAYADGTITVHIRDSANNPISNASVEFREGGSKHWFYTDALGDFTASMTPGTYTVLITAADHASEYWSDSFTRAGSTPLTVTEGGAYVLDVKLADEATITGVVTDYTSAPVDGQVQIFSENAGGDYLAQAITTVTGSYSFGDLAPGTYKLVAITTSSDNLVDEWYSNAYTQASATTVIIPAVAGTATADFVLEQGATIVGTVTNTIGSPLSVSVRPTNAVQGEGGYENSGTDGAYDISGLLPGATTVTTSDHFSFFEPVTSPALAATAGGTVAHDFVLVPQIPDESDFYEHAALTGPTTVEAGQTYTWTVSVNGDSDAYAILYSDPVYLGAATQNGSGIATLTLTIPASTDPGTHKLTYSSYDTGPQAFQVTRDYFTLTVTAAKLPATGTDAGAGGLAALLLLLAGGLLLVRRRLAP
jgi:LPXTG-motif cell wall-anchored protein